MSVPSLTYVFNNPSQLKQMSVPILTYIVNNPSQLNNECTFSDLCLQQSFSAKNECTFSDLRL